ncbi:MAG: 3' terminal RNA ribose 2'-O-methyltransferase Hen1 [Beijerinckiaceae bacterium]|nr:3' terminal RNA ribose 2'-O-methyltransferase Hen1 [Beijerinckiaceae bacterium]
MFLSVTTTHYPATDLGFLLRKNPARMHETELSFGRALTLYPEASDERCTAALVLEVDPVGLVRGKGDAGGLIDQYVNDRPYAASSFLSVGMGRAWREAIAGQSKDRQDLADAAIPLEAHVTPLPARGGAGLVSDLFTPLGYEVTVAPIALDQVRTDWGDSPYVALTLKATTRLSALLTHLYVLIPVLDDRKHYFVGDDELQKLMAKGEGWLADHPLKELIVSRYLKRRRSLVQDALVQLAGDEGESETALDAAPKDTAEEAIEKPLRLHDLRLDTVAQRLKDLGAKRVLDLGCGEAKLIRRLVADKQFEEIVGVEVSSVSLARADEKLERLPELQRARIKLLQGALIYRDQRLRGFDAAALVEVIEHVEPDRLDHLERAVFGDAQPKAVIVTTPNADYNALFPTLPAGQFRHADHRFEWTRAEFAAWCARIGEAYGYGWVTEPLGPVDEALGAPSQMAVFTR